MLVGTAPLEALAAGVATVPEWRAEPATLEGVEIVQAMFELPYASREALLPPSLHPTNPPTAVVQAWRCEASPWGPFSLAQVRVQCRSGLRPRGFVVGCAVDDADAAAGLAAGWGFAPRVGQVEVRRFYDASTVDVSLDGVAALRLRGTDPDPLGSGDVAYSSTLNLAHTPNGLRLVQVDADVELERVERLRPGAVELDAAAWRTPLVELRAPVSASVGVGRIVLQGVRFCCRPDVLAFEGTESVLAPTP